MKKILLFCAALLVTLAAQAQEVQTNALVNTTDATVITKQGTHFYLGDNKLSHKELKGLMRNTSPELYKQYRTGYNLIGAGWYFTASSAVIFATGAGLAISDLYARPSVLHCHPGWGTWVTLFFVPFGSAFAATGIPMLCVGYNKRNKSIDAYNIVHTTKEPVVTYSLTAGQNGIGFAVNF